MIPKKIYIAENSAKELCKKRYVWDCNASEELIDEGAWKINTPYILESEHNRIVESYKNRIKILEKLIPQSNEIKNHDGDF